jgi:hypothetical protein
MLMPGLLGGGMTGGQTSARRGGIGVERNEAIGPNSGTDRERT